jgi:hypothetical protein
MNDNWVIVMLFILGPLSTYVWFVYHNVTSAIKEKESKDEYKPRMPSDVVEARLIRSRHYKRSIAYRRFR